MLLLVSVLAAGCAAPSAQEPVAGASEPVLVVDGEEIAGETFARWLIEQRGSSLAREFAEAWAIGREAERRGVRVPEASVTEELEGEIETRVRHAFRGQREGWLAELERLGRSEAGHRRERRIELRPELETRAMAAVGRVVPEDKIVREWELDHGPRGRELALSMMRFEVEVLTPAAGAPPEDLERNRELAFREGLRRAQAARARLLAGEDFSALARELSDDPATRATGGRPPERFRRAGWPAAFVERMVALEPREVSEPLYARGGYWIVRLEAAHETPLESVREALTARLIERGPEQDETGRLWNELTRGLELELLPGLFEPPREAEEAAGPVMGLSIDGEAVQRSVYARWLVGTRGEALASHFAEHWLVERRARRAGISVDEAELDARVVEYVDRRVLGGHGGSRERWRTYLAASGQDRTGFERELRARLRIDLLAEKLILAERVVSEADLRRRYEQVFGPGGRWIVARWILLRIEAPTLEPGLSRDEVERRVEAAREAARSRAVELALRLENGEDFATLARRHSADPETAPAGGFLPDRFRPEAWSAEVAAAVTALEPGQVSAPLWTPEGWALFELVGVRQVALDEVREELRAELASERPPPSDLALYRNVLRKAVQVRTLPALVE